MAVAAVAGLVAGLLGGAVSYGVAEQMQTSVPATIGGVELPQSSADAPPIKEGTVAAIAATALPTVVSLSVEGRIRGKKYPRAFAKVLVPHLRTHSFSSVAQLYEGSRQSTGYVWAKSRQECNVSNSKHHTYERITFVACSLWTTYAPTPWPTHATACQHSRRLCTEGVCVTQLVRL